jgi:hypothetical protein
MHPSTEVRDKVKASAVEREFGVEYRNNLIILMSVSQADALTSCLSAVLDGVAVKEADRSLL